MSTPFDPQQPQQPQQPSGQVDPLTGEPIPGTGQPEFQQSQFYPGAPGFTAQPDPVIPEPRKRRTGLFIGAVVATVAVLGGGVTLVALNNSEPVKVAQPADVARDLVAAVAKNDLVGILDRLHPGEAKLFRDAMEKQAAEYKRLGVYKPEADPVKLPENFVKAEGVEFDGPGQQINDRLTVHSFAKGRITVNPEAGNTSSVYTEKFQKLMDSLGGGNAAVTETTTIDLERVAREIGHKPTLATVKVGGTWYASFFYSIADNGLKAAKKSWPQQSIPARGADSPEQAVRELITAAVDLNVTRVIELLPAEEMAVLHDMGQVLVTELSADEPPSARLLELETKTTDVPGGKKISPTKVVVQVEGQKYTVERQGDCVLIPVQNQQRKVCVDQLLAGMEAAAAQRGIELSEAAFSVLDRLAMAVLNIGVVTVEQGGKHFLSPATTVSELGLSFLRELQPADIDELIKLGR
ncbi:flagellar basal body protein FliL [Crossiella cryophila]|uniref:Uncharacterized protein n=1 Tax=Crossiella cryophila TaxID=43355 RepID=A0A7W7CAW6_9PSEU|nr:flagellar basal body protein FliL [Crossiella cryophila]MBB4677627.1 hypothetical protein [Crossiella cryophila]